MSSAKPHLIVIGAGSGGLVAAIGLAKIGYQTTLIEKHKIGGDCTNYGCVPSKALLHRARELAVFREKLTQQGYLLNGLQSKLKKQAAEVLAEARQVVARFNEEESAEWLKSYGIDVIFGQAKFCSPKEIEVLDSSGLPVTKLEFDKAIIASGSRPAIPNIDGLNQIDYLTNETVFQLTEVPDSLTILGNGPVGIELAQAFNDLGSQVTVVGLQKNILTRSDPELSQELQTILSQRGVRFFHGQTSKVLDVNGQVRLEFADGQTLQTAKLLVAVGRQANLDLNLPAAEIVFEPKGIQINRHCRTSNKNIYAIGDCAQVPKFTHLAGHMGQTVVKNLAGHKYTHLPLDWFGYNQLIPAITFTAPELAQAGLTEQEAKTQYGAKQTKVFRFKLANVDRAKAQGHEEGQLKLITKGWRAKIVGVHILGERAGEMLPELQRLMQEEKPILALGKIIRAYPSYTANLDKLVLEWLSGWFGKSK